MWVLGTIVVLIAGAAVTVALGWTPRALPSPPLWKTSEQGGGYAGNAATFAGFSFASATFIAGLGDARSAPEFATVFGLMLSGFLILVVAVWIGGSTPNAPQAGEATAPSLALMLVLGNMSNNLGVSVTGLALVPLMAVVGLNALASVFVWPLLVMVIAAGAWVALVAYRLTLANVRACVAIPVLGLALPALFWLVADRFWPDLWPASEPALHFAFVALAAAGLMFALHLGLLVAHGNTALQQRLRRNCHRIVLGCSQAYVMVVALIWFAVAWR